MIQHVLLSLTLAGAALLAGARPSYHAQLAGSVDPGHAPAADITAPREMPFGPGEELVYDVRSSRFGRIGEAFMRVDGPEIVHGREAYVLSFDFSARVLLFRVSDRTRSWFDPRTASSLRYTKRERSPLRDRDEDVEILPDRNAYVEDGDTAALATTTPLDELSFLYYVRMLPLEDGDVYRLERHFDVRRNPVTVTVLGRESPHTPAGTPPGRTQPLIAIELHVPDARQQEGTSRLRLFLTDDALRVPVRIETSMPVGGSMVLELADGPDRNR